MDLKRRSTLFETSFVYYLNIMELLETFVLFSTFRLDETVPIKSRELTTLILGFSLQIGLLAGLMHWVDRRSISAKEVQAFVTACENSGVVVPIPPGSSAWANKYNKSLRNFLTVLVILLLFAAVWICVLITNSKPKYRSISVSLVSTGLATGMAYSFAKMHLARVQLARLNEDDYEDNEWGFGQIIALFIWIPLLVELSLPLLFAGSRLLRLSAVWRQAKEAVKRNFQKPQQGSSEQQAEHVLEDQFSITQAGNRAVEEAQVAAGITRRNTPRTKSPA